MRWPPEGELMRRRSPPQRRPAVPSCWSWRGLATLLVPVLRGQNPCLTPQGSPLHIITYQHGQWHSWISTQPYGKLEVQRSAPKREVAMSVPALDPAPSPPLHGPSASPPPALSPAGEVVLEVVRKVAALGRQSATHGIHSQDRTASALVRVRAVARPRD